MPQSLERLVGVKPVDNSLTSAPRPSIEFVASGGLCVGCGACAVATGSRIPVQPNHIGHFAVNLTSVSEADLQTASTVCPFANESPNENAVSDRLFSSLPHHHHRTGRYLRIYAGRFLGDEVINSSSGGLTTWLVFRLLELGLVDGVIHVGSGAESSGGLFEYCVSYSAEEIARRRKSQYYSTSIEDSIRRIRGDGKRYAFVGVPCFITAVRHLTSRDPVLKGQIRYCIGLVCGHLKSRAFAELLAWQVGVPPSQLARVDFRVKDPTKRANDYDFQAWDKNGSAKSRQANSLVGGNWGHAMLQLRACDYCDDVFSETADVVFGDAWLPQYTSDWRGTNVVLTRDAKIDSILREGSASGVILLEPLSKKRAVASQDGNFRHRWDGLSLRLADDRVEGRWSPQKRISASSHHLGEPRRRIVRLRRQLAEKSHVAFSEAKELDSLDHYLAAVLPLTDAIGREYARVRRQRLSRVRNLVRAMLRRVFLRLQHFGYPSRLRPGSIS